MSDHVAHPLYNPKTHFAVQISTGVFPKSMDDLNSLHKDPTYEIVSGTREAYFMKKIAGLLSRKVAQSEDVRNLAHLVQDSARELERNWRMAACISNTPVSTGYPYLPIMPTLKSATGVAASDSSTAQPSVASSPSTVPMGVDQSSLKKADMEFIFRSIMLPFATASHVSGQQHKLSSFI